MEFGALLPVALFIQCLIGNSDRMIVSSCYVLMALFIRWHDAMASHAMVVMFSVFARLAQVLEYQMSQYTVCVFLSGTYVPKLIPDTSTKTIHHSKIFPTSICNKARDNNILAEVS